MECQEHPGTSREIHWKSIGNPLGNSWEIWEISTDLNKPLEFRRKIMITDSHGASFGKWFHLILIDFAHLGFYAQVPYTASGTHGLPGPWQLHTFPVILTFR